MVLEHMRKFTKFNDLGKNGESHFLSVFSCKTIFVTCSKSKLSKKFFGMDILSMMSDMDKIIEEAKAEILPFESWEKLKGESSLAYTAFCAFRDLGSERSIRKAVETVEVNENLRMKRYNVFRGWAAQFKWRERAADYDRYVEKLKQAELRKTIEAQGELHREVTGKMLDVVKKKLDTMNPAELSQGNLTEWVQVAIKSEREAAGLVSSNGKPEQKQGEFCFVSDFQGL